MSLPATMEGALKTSRQGLLATLEMPNSSFGGGIFMKTTGLSSVECCE